MLDRSSAVCKCLRISPRNMQSMARGPALILPFEHLSMPIMTQGPSASPLGHDANAQMLKTWDQCTPTSFPSTLHPHLLLNNDSKPNTLRTTGKSCAGAKEMEVREARKAAGVVATFKRVDTCAAEFEAATPYMYSSYDGNDECESTNSQKVGGQDCRCPT